MTILNWQLSVQSADEIGTADFIPVEIIAQLPEKLTMFYQCSGYQKGLKSM
jgi:hypothetical protein